MAPSAEFGANHPSNLKTTLHLSQQAPDTFRQLGKPLVQLSTFNQQGSDDFDTLEKLFFSCIQSADDESALLCLEHLTNRFGSSNEKVMALRGLYDEATAENQARLERCLNNYDDILSRNPVNLPILKRRASVLRSLSRPSDAISCVVQLLDAVPTDVEAWCELAELYHSQGMSPQAIFSLEEALLIVPHAWTVHARLGEISYIFARSLEGEAMSRSLSLSIRHFCRSVELCDDYLRGFYGLALATTPSLVTRIPETSRDGLKKKETIERLHSTALRKLQETLSTQYSRKPHLREYEENELSVVKELLGQSSK
ncbi:uncharacterized protein BJX67DRAFT_381722 [Aspergillus lucknowensis]|uniref:ER membrane protein complex subunit 2 n=1 Tax=Aspergillus lucknowensis TaxID=176173 RepID=A0ABR4LQI8_9EURO